MNVRLRLTRRAEAPAQADAFLLFAADAGPLVEACKHLRPSVPTVFAIRGGFLLVPPDGDGRIVPAAVRLHRMTADLFVPADGVLSPALLSDEMVALTRDCGLVLLPGGEVLAFDPHAPLPVDRWLAPSRVRRESWEPFPLPSLRAERLSVIERPSPPPVAVIEILGAGRPDGAEPLPGAGEAGAIPEDARPPRGSVLGGIAAAAALGAGRFLAWLGRNLAMPGLARRGADLARKAIESVPRLTEKLFGAQEAALREVLRQLQSGDVEKALRRAPAAVPDPDLPSRVGTNAYLGSRDPRYSLRDLLGWGSGGVAIGWFGGGDVWGALAREYRRLAQEAAARGDHRRAAYLYGVLLRDLRSAANALIAGGLFRDAGVLFRDKLKDEPAAAAAFEQAGDYDEALRLLDRLGRYEQAGELLRRLGDDERALDYFTRAADGLAARGQWLAAGDLIRRKAGDRDGASRYYRCGWDADAADAIACGERLLDETYIAEAWDDAVALFGEAERRLVPPRAAEAGRFFNYALGVGADYLPPEMRDDLADRVRGLFAAHLRANGSEGGWDPVLMGNLFGKPGAWPAPVVRDATVAARGLPRRFEPAAHPPPFRLADGSVTSVALARDMLDLVVGTTAAVVLWRTQEGRVIPVGPASGRVIGLATDPAGRVVHVLSGVGDRVRVRCFLEGVGNSSFQAMGQLEHDGWDPDAGDWYLEPTVSFERGDYRVTLTTPAGREELLGFYLQASTGGPFLPHGVNTHLLVRDGDWAWDWDERFVRCHFGDRKILARWLPHWAPGVPPGSSLSVPHVDWITPLRGVLEVVGVDRDGVLHWSEFDGRDKMIPRSRSASAPGIDGYTAACMVSRGAVVASTQRNELHWLTVHGTGFHRTANMSLAVPARVVALVARPPEVVAVLDDASVVRITRP